MPAIHPSVLRILPLLAAALAVFLISLPALHGPLVLDSVKLHVLEGLLEKHGSDAVLHTPGFGGGLAGFDRIVAMASFVLNIQLSGELSAFSVKLTNIGLHIVTGTLVFLLTRLLLGTTPWAGNATLVAACTAVLWLLSPVNFNVAAYAVQRMTQLSALFSLAGLCLYVAARLSEDTARRWSCIVLAAGVCLPLAVLSKPNGILLIALAFVVEIYFLHPARPRLTKRQLTLIGVLGAAGGLALLLYLYPGALNYQFRDFTLTERLLSQPRALVSYLRHLVLPYGSDTAVYSDDFAASVSLAEPPSTALAVLGCAAMVLCCAVFRRGPVRLVTFGLAFFLVGHAMESTFVPLELYFLHRNYLPDYGIYFALACLFVLALPGRRLAIALLAVYAAYFGALSYARAVTWSSRANIAAAAVHYHPDSPRALSDYTQVALEQGEFRLSLAAIDRAIALDDTVNAHIQRLYVVCRAGMEITGEEYTGIQNSESFGVANELSQALNNLLELYRSGGCGRLEVRKLVESLDVLAARYHRSGGDFWTIEYYTVSFLHAAGYTNAALERLQRRLDNGHLESGLYRLELLIEQYRGQDAALTLEQITTQFKQPRLDQYRATIQDFRQRIEALAPEK